MEMSSLNERNNCGDKKDANKTTGVTNIQCDFNKMYISI